MIAINRKNSVAILLILLLSHAALTLHVSTHIPIDQSNCDYCAGHADPGHAITPTIAHIPLSVSQDSVVPVAALLSQARPFHAYRQRAPPTHL
jgi:hypothetical protein